MGPLRRAYAGSEMGQPAKRYRVEFVRIRRAAVEDCHYAEVFDYATDRELHATETYATEAECQRAVEQWLAANPDQ